MGGKVGKEEGNLRAGGEHFEHPPLARSESVDKGIERHNTLKQNNKEKQQRIALEGATFTDQSTQSPNNEQSGKDVDHTQHRPTRKTQLQDNRQRAESTPPPLPKEVIDSITKTNSTQQNLHSLSPGFSNSNFNPNPSYGVVQQQTSVPFRVQPGGLPQVPRTTAEDMRRKSVSMPLRVPVRKGQVAQTQPEEGQQLVIPKGNEESRGRGRSSSVNKMDVNRRRSSLVVQNIQSAINTGALPDAMAVLAGDVNLKKYKRKTSRGPSHKRTQSLPPRDVTIEGTEKTSGGGGVQKAKPKRKLPEVTRVHSLPPTGSYSPGGGLPPPAQSQKLAQAIFSGGTGSPRKRSTSAGPQHMRRNSGRLPPPSSNPQVENTGTPKRKTRHMRKNSGKLPPPSITTGENSGPQQPNIVSQLKQAQHIRRNSGKLPPPSIITGENNNTAPNALSSPVRHFQTTGQHIRRGSGRLPPPNNDGRRSTITAGAQTSPRHIVSSGLPTFDPSQRRKSLPATSIVQQQQLVLQKSFSHHQNATKEVKRYPPVEIRDVTTSPRSHVSSRKSSRRRHNNLGRAHTSPSKHSNNDPNAVDAEVYDI